MLDWTAAALDRVDRSAFFDKFSEGEAVPYFYEPFLEAFDPALRKQLGVWYTPSRGGALYGRPRGQGTQGRPGHRADGLAAENVYVLDPCCGTGAYLAETLKRIAANLREPGAGRSHRCAGEAGRHRSAFSDSRSCPLRLSSRTYRSGLPCRTSTRLLSEDGNERAGVFLTNALTGWEPRDE